MRISDWSSDVCSSDLADHLPEADRERILRDLVQQTEELSLLVEDVVELARGDAGSEAWEDVRLDLLVEDVVDRARTHAPGIRFEIGRAPCREGVCQYV